MGIEILVFMLGALAILLVLLGVYGTTMDAKMLIFTPMISVASGICLMVFYRKVFSTLRGIWQQWHGSWSRRDLDLGALARSFVIEVLFQRQLFRDNRVRWVRHIFIYWGFVGLWIFDLVFFFFTKIVKVPQRDPLHLFLDFGLEVYGGILLIGLTVALIRAYFVRGSKGSIYNDTPAVVLFFIVATSGFLLEALRLAAVPYEPYMAWSFIGLGLARLLQNMVLPWDALYQGVWIFHAIIASAAIAYIPLNRMVHIIAVPTGRLLESQQKMLAAKIESVGHGLMGR